MFLSNVNRTVFLPFHLKKLQRKRQILGQKQKKFFNRLRVNSNPRWHEREEEGEGAGVGVMGVCVWVWVCGCGCVGVGVCECTCKCVWVRVWAEVGWIISHPKKPSKDKGTRKFYFNYCLFFLVHYFIHSGQFFRFSVTPRPNFGKIETKIIFLVCVSRVICFDRYRSRSR